MAVNSLQTSDNKVFDTKNDLPNTPPISIPLHIKKFIETTLQKDPEPIYVYDISQIQSACSAFNLPYEPLSIHFATMANSHADFLNCIRDQGANVFVNSIEHLKKVQTLGFTGKRIMYTASAMSASTMHAVHASGAMVNLDSCMQIKQWQSLYPCSEFGIRCNIGSLVDAKKTRGGYFIGKESRLGLFPDEIKALSGNLYVNGLHLYVGTDICSIDYFKTCYEALASFAHLFPNLDYLDLGGGFGLTNELGNRFDFEAYGTMVCDFMSSVNAKLGRTLQVILEPGRCIGALAGYFACQVIDIKQGETGQFCGVNASSVQFPRPLFYPDSAFHPALLIPKAGSLPGPLCRTSVYGCSTYSRDFLARDILLPCAHPGDIIVFGEAGAYCASAYTHFLGFAPAKELFL